jgi:hypothetical protein
MKDFFYDSLNSFFKKNADNIALVFNQAQCCRELWLQGQIFLWFRKNGYNSFMVNCFKLRDGGKADFSLNRPRRIVCEMKVLGNDDYQLKTITGGKIKELKKCLDRKIGFKDKHLCEASWGLLPDYFRLIKEKRKSERTSYLILVAHVNVSKKDTMLNILNKINFEGIELPRILLSIGFVRIWKI